MDIEMKTKKKIKFLLKRYFWETKKEQTGSKPQKKYGYNVFETLVPYQKGGVYGS